MVLVDSPVCLIQMLQGTLRIRMRHCMRRLRDKASAFDALRMKMGWSSSDPRISLPKAACKAFILLTPKEAGATHVLAFI